MWSNKRTVLKTTLQKLEANSCCQDKSLVLATHGRWLAKSPGKGLASDRPRQASIHLLISRHLENPQILNNTTPSSRRFPRPTYSRYCPPGILILSIVYMEKKNTPDVDTRLNSLGRTALLSLSSFTAVPAPRGHSEVIPRC